MNSKIHIPKSWSEITIDHQINVEKLCAENPNYKSIAIIAGYCGLQIDEVKRMNINEVKELLNSLTFLNENLPSEPISEFIYKEDTYSVIPTLLQSEFQDFISIETILEQNKNQEYKTLPYIIAVLAKKKISNAIGRQVFQLNCSNH